MADPLRAQVEPEDIVQSVFKSIFRGMNAGVYEAPAGGSLWHLIAVIAVHKVRKNASRRLAEKRDARKTQSLDDFDGDLDTEQLSPEAMECAIREAVEGLKESEQEIVMLRVQGYSVEEIAQRVNKSRRTTERLLQSARESLGAMLDVNQN
jgi:RNA polymerase sigma-70 factor (ECF subfamily)